MRRPRRSGAVASRERGLQDADDHVAVLDRALAQNPAEYVESSEISVRADSAGATHGLVHYCREANMRFSVGYELTEQVRAAILTIPADAWVQALDQDGSARKNGEVAEVTDMVDVSAWPKGCRLIVLRERMECRQRQHAHVEDRIRDDKDTGLAKFSFKA